MSGKTHFAELHRQVVFGQSHGKIIWQPRIQCWLSDRLFAGGSLPPPYTGMTHPQLYRDLNCSARPYWRYNQALVRVEHPSVRIISSALNETDTQKIIETPAGKQVSIRRRPVSSWSSFFVKYEVETEEEMKVAAWREENATWTWNQQAFDEALAEWGDLGAPTAYLPRMNVQSLYVEAMGTEKGVLALYDWPDTVEAFFRAKEECHNRLIDVVNRSPIEIINFGENVHAGTLPPSLFLKYHLPACQRRCERLHRAGKFICSHWDGDTRPLLQYARQTGLDGIEAITPKPQGDVTLDEIKEGLGDTMFLLDGIPAILFDEIYPVSMLEDCVHRLIELFAPRLVLGISDEMSSTGDIERVRIVGKIVEKYNESLT